VTSSVAGGRGGTLGAGGADGADGEPAARQKSRGKVV